MVEGGCERLRDCGDALTLVEQAAQAALVNDLAQCFLAAVERALPVAVPEKRRVGESRPNYALVAVADFVRVLAFEIGDGDKPGQQDTIVVGDREVSLVSGQCRGHGLPRQLKKRLVEAADDGHRPFNERRDLVVKRFAAHRLPAGGFRCGLNAVANHRAPSKKVGDDMPVIFQRRKVAVGRCDRNGIGAMKTVAPRLPAGRNTQHLSVNDVVAMQHDNPVHRPHKLNLVSAPAHAAGNRQSLERIVDEARQQCAGGLPLLNAFMNEPGALVGFPSIEFGDVDTALLCERQCRRCRIALIVEGNVNGRAFLF